MRRDATIPRIRCRREQLEDWQRAAKRAGWSFSEWVRLALDFSAVSDRELQDLRLAQRDDRAI